MISVHLFKYKPSNLSKNYKKKSKKLTHFNALLKDGDAKGTVAGLGGDSKLKFIW